MTTLSRTALVLDLARPAPTPPAVRRTASIGQRAADPWLRAQLPAAVLAKPVDGTVGREAWWQVAQCLEATGHALACAFDGTDPSTTAVLVTFALDDTTTARLALQGHGRAAQDTAPVPSDGPASPVERTWLRLAALLAAPGGATDPGLLEAVLTEHVAALEAWREVLRGPARAHALDEAV